MNDIDPLEETSMATLPDGRTVVLARRRSLPVDVDGTLLIMLSACAIAICLLNCALMLANLISPMTGSIAGLTFAMAFALYAKKVWHWARTPPLEASRCDVVGIDLSEDEIAVKLEALHQNILRYSDYRVIH